MWKFTTAAGAEKFAVAPIGIGTSLPTSPYDGQEFILVDSLTNPTYQWRFRYLATNSDAYKWVCVGGSEVALSGGSSATASTSPVALTGGAQFTAPRAGIYRVDFGLFLQNNGSYVGPYNLVAQMYLVAGSVPQGLQALFIPVANFAGACVSSVAYPTLAAADVLEIRVWASVASQSNTFSNAWIKVRPQKVS